jgi:hypothetical protein
MMPFAKHQHPLLLSLSKIVTWALLITCVTSSMTVTSTFLHGPVNDPCVDDSYLRGLVNDPRIAGGLVNDPCNNYLRGPVNDPRVAGGLVNDPRKKYLCGPVNDPCVAGGLVNDPCKHILATIPPVSPQDNPSSLKKLIVVLFNSLSLKSFRCRIG